MVIKEKEVLGIISQIQRSVESGEVPIDLVPMNDLLNLLDATLGGSFWKRIGTTSQDAFDTIPTRYKMLLEHCQSKKDAEGFVLVLELMKNQYRCTYAALSKEEIDRRTKNYKVFILNIGSAMASLQYWIHKSHKETETEYSISFGKEIKGAVYTCLVGANSVLHQPEYINVYLDYICFTDKEEKWGTKDGVWEYRKMERKEEEESNSSMYFRYKIKPHEVLGEYDYSIWVNAQMQIVGEVEQLYEIYGRGNSFLAFPAYVQDNLYEAVHTSLNADDANIELRRSLLHYREEGFPEYYGMISTNMMYRSHKDEILNQAMDIWLRESERCSQMREFGFSYGAWKSGLKFAICSLFAEWNSYIKNRDLDLEVDEDK